MPDQTPILALPVLVPNQAQPYVTHNEALRRLDILVQLSVLEFGAETPPALPEEGDLYALGAAPVAEWAGQAHKLAAWIDGAWLFVAPQPGWRAWDRDTGVLRVWDGAGWIRSPADLDNVAGLGIGTASDPVNRLAVKSDAVLFSHDGAGHQLKINKAGDTDSASLLFQSGWTGHAEIGLAGDTDLSIKVSPDGSAWTEALRFDAASGEAFGAALQSGPGDTSAGRIPKMGNDADFADLTADSVTTDGVVSAKGGLYATSATDTDISLLRARDSTLANCGQLAALNFDGAGGRADWQFQNSIGEIQFVNTGDVTVGHSGVPDAKLDVQHSKTSKAVIQGAASSASFANSVQTLTCSTAASASYSFFAAYSSGGDLEARISGVGNGTCDGSWTGGGADYAEFFEWTDGNPLAEDRRGLSVVLEGDKIRPALDGEDPIGAISANPSVVGDGDIDRWKGKYLRDDFEAYLWEDYEVVEWAETVTEGEGDDATTREVSHSYAADQVPEGVTVPADATRTTQQRRKLNPVFDPDLPYIPRAERLEWDTVGLMGKLRLRKGQPTGARWIKMRDVSAGVEEWLVR